MQTPASQPHKRCRVPGIVMMSCATAATLLTWAPCSIGSANDNPVPVKLSAVPFQVAGAKQAPVDLRRESSERPTRPTCAELAGIASTQATERTGESNVALGCGAQNNVADGTHAGDQLEERIDVATFLAWHSQTPPPEQSQSTHGARVSGQLSMGPDPGGKTGATVSPTTTKTGQPSADGAGASNGTSASNQSAVTSTVAPGVARDRTDPKTAPAGSSATSKE